MDDIFDQSAEVRPHVDVHKLLWEAKAELNGLEKKDAETIEARREIGRKFKEAVDAIGRGGISEAARQAKVDEKTIKGHIALYEAPDCVDHEQAMQILWGHKPKEPSGRSGASASESKPPAHPKLWKAFNHLDGYCKALAEHAQEPDAYEAIAKHMKAIEKKLQDLEKKVGQ